MEIRAVERPTPPPVPLTGGCLCGAVRYKLSSLPRAINACHCKDCKKLSGGSHAVLLHVERPTLACESGDLVSFDKTGDSGNVISIKRCAVCGIRMWLEPQMAPGLMFVSAGTLDQTDWIVPSSHIFLRSAEPGDLVASDAIALDGPPTDRKALWGRFDEIYGIKRDDL
jgi:hypothetical protein